MYQLFEFYSITLPRAILAFNSRLGYNNTKR